MRSLLHLSAYQHSPGRDERATRLKNHLYEKEKSWHDAAGKIKAVSTAVSVYNANNRKAMNDAQLDVALKEASNFAARSALAQDASALNLHAARTQKVDTTKSIFDHLHVILQSIPQFFPSATTLFWLSLAESWKKFCGEKCLWQKFHFDCFYLALEPQPSRLAWLATNRIPFNCKLQTFPPPCSP